MNAMHAISSSCESGERLKQFAHSPEKLDIKVNK